MFWKKNKSTQIFFNLISIVLDISSFSPPTYWIVICGLATGGSAINSELSGRGPDAARGGGGCIAHQRASFPGGAGLNECWRVACTPPVARSHAARGTSALGLLQPLSGPETL